MATEIRYPDIEVELSEHDGNALIIIGRTTKALRRAGVSNDEIDKFSTEARRGDYDHVLQTVMAWVDVS